MSTESYAPSGMGPFPATPLISPAVAAPPAPAAATEIPAEGGIALAPVRFDERISAIDTVRGMAVLGIFLSNICDFGLPFTAYYTLACGSRRRHRP